MPCCFLLGGTKEDFSKCLGGVPKVPRNHTIDAWRQIHHPRREGGRCAVQRSHATRQDSLAAKSLVCLHLSAMACRQGMSQQKKKHIKLLERPGIGGRGR